MCLWSSFRLSFPLSPLPYPQVVSVVRLAHLVVWSCLLAAHRSSDKSQRGVSLDLPGSCPLAHVPSPHSPVVGCALIPELIPVAGWKGHTDGPKINSKWDTLVNLSKYMAGWNWEWGLSHPNHTSQKYRVKSVKKGDMGSRGSCKKKKSPLWKGRTKSHLSVYYHFIHIGKGLTLDKLRLTGYINKSQGATIPGFGRYNRRFCI